ncbi:MAG TPA: bifunctional nuclease family protein [Candidatus Krumholzibacteria bacterium]|nr:bifunctional nuclease family protein [Candidatus Krumholzibacteria bacterium]
MALNEKHFVRVAVSGMARDARENPVVLLKSSEGEEVLPIWIGHAEGLAIELTMKGEKFERPLTHDLLKTAIEGLGAVLAKVAITELRNNTFFAKLYLQRDQELIVVDARPSDSVALALKCDAPIFVARDVFASHKRSLGQESGPGPDSDDELRRYLKDLDPGDF